MAEFFDSFGKLSDKIGFANAILVAAMAYLLYTANANHKRDSKRMQDVADEYKKINHDLIVSLQGAIIGVGDLINTTLSKIEGLNKSIASQDKVLEQVKEQYSYLREISDKTTELSSRLDGTISIIKELMHRNVGGGKDGQ